MGSQGLAKPVQVSGSAWPDHGFGQHALGDPKAWPWQLRLWEAKPWDPKA